MLMTQRTLDHRPKASLMLLMLAYYRSLRRRCRAHTQLGVLIDRSREVKMHVALR